LDFEVNFRVSRLRVVLWTSDWCPVEPYLDADLVQLLNDDLEVVEGADAPAST